MGKLKLRCMGRDCPNRLKTVLTNTIVCAYCGEHMSEAHDFKSIYFGKFSSSSAAEQKEALRKRATEHSNSKTEQERKEYLIKKAAKIE
jgi:hypothetical protein